MRMIRVLYCVQTIQPINKTKRQNVPFVPHIVPQLIGVFLKETPRRILRSNGVDDALGEPHFLLLGKCHVQLLVGTHQCSPLCVARVRIGLPACFFWGGLVSESGICKPK